MTNSRSDFFPSDRPDMSALRYRGVGPNVKSPPDKARLFRRRSAQSGKRFAFRIGKSDCLNTVISFLPERAPSMPRLIFPIESGSESRRATIALDPACSMPSGFKAPAAARRVPCRRSGGAPGGNAAAPIPSARRRRGRAWRGCRAVKGAKHELSICIFSRCDQAPAGSKSIRSMCAVFSFDAGKYHMRLNDVGHRAIVGPGNRCADSRCEPQRWYCMSALVTSG